MDSQRSALYTWERSLPQYTAAGPMTLDECKALIAKVWADYRPGSIPPKVTDGRGTTWAKGASWRINLPRWARSPLVVLHEVAHGLSMTSDDWHGPVFATLCLELWGKYVPGFDKVAARKAGIAQRPRRVHFATVAACPRPVSRTYRVWNAERARLYKALHEHEAKKPSRY